MQGKCWSRAILPIPTTAILYGISNSWSDHYRGKLKRDFPFKESS
jgi:hypothetical protein